jgi:hypothetical protein
VVREIHALDYYVRQGFMANLEITIGEDLKVFPVSGDIIPTNNRYDQNNSQ